jgi:serine/threonine-protein kinase
MDGDPLRGVAPGVTLGRYRVERLLGEGGMGAVFLATHTGLRKPVVLKVLHPQYGRSPGVRQRFLREGEAAARIRHPHVVDVTDVGEDQGVAWLVMEYLEGESLGARLDRGVAMPPAEAMDILLPVLAAVQAAHDAGVVHRDLKPDNIFLSRAATGEEVPKVLDFGISRVVDDDGADTRNTGSVATLGTPGYMAPEQIDRARDADPRSDVYALGVILYECLCARAPFDGATLLALLRNVAIGHFDAPRALRPELHPALESAVLRAMSLDPAGRFASAREMAAALLPFASDATRARWTPFFGAGPSSPPAEVARQTAAADTIPDGPRRSRTPWALGAAALALTVVAVAARWPRPSSPPVPRASPVSAPPAAAASSPAVPPRPTIAATAPAESAAATPESDAGAGTGVARPHRHRPRPNAADPAGGFDPRSAGAP